MGGWGKKLAGGLTIVLGFLIYKLALGYSECQKLKFVAETDNPFRFREKGRDHLHASHVPTN
ncbi:MAG: hypothetical protein COV69_02245 [Parcubacteria group bacterium CG11_big_fil_rev_8_21_14_0_20_39_14]|nr:MAG: hypothetical protein COV69_02245 [Parcubacteria group bacterium CG11_big_fil_rev_8_21_14_0_20_39_14]PIS35311.1 MAG: hypothetical protein COT36_03085 [Parcubacteria group bacterium CG08_land_8_20_14_0_20_38_56]